MRAQSLTYSGVERTENGGAACQFAQLQLEAPRKHPRPHSGKDDKTVETYI